MSVRFLTYECPRCRLTIPAKSRARKRFDSFCPKCQRRITILWPSRKKSIWDDRRGRERVVSFRLWYSWPEAKSAANARNLETAKARHQVSIFGQERMDAGFIQASRLTQEELTRKREILRRELMKDESDRI